LHGKAFFKFCQPKDLLLPTKGFTLFLGRKTRKLHWVFKVKRVRVLQLYRAKSQLKLPFCQPKDLPCFWEENKEIQLVSKKCAFNLYRAKSQLKLPFYQPKVLLCFWKEKQGNLPWLKVKRK
jgi:hypothetical protein